MSEQQSGFTLVELLIATTIFSFAFIIIAVGFIEINKMYRQGITIRRVQQTSRFIVDDMLRAARTANSIRTVAAGEGIVMEYPNRDPVTFCKEADGARFVVNRYSPVDAVVDDCSNTSGFVSIRENMMERGVYASDVVLQPLVGSRNAKVTINLVTGATDLTTAADDDCNAGAGRQFCATSTVSTTVTARGGSGA